jgi:hypothetical protein
MFISPVVTYHKKYKCNKPVMRYLVYDCHLPVFSYDDKGFYYFVDNAQLQKCLKEMPLLTRVLSKM